MSVLNRRLGKRKLDLGIASRWVVATVGVVCILIATILFSIEPVLAWYDNAWTYRKELTVDHNQVDADLTNFPLLVSLESDADLA